MWYRLCPRGEFWGNLGYVYVEKGNNALMMESMCSWATPKAWTEHNFACDEGARSHCVFCSFVRMAGAANASAWPGALGWLRC